MFKIMKIADVCHLKVGEALFTEVKFVRKHKNTAANGIISGRQNWWLTVTYICEYLTQNVTLHTLSVLYLYTAARTAHATHALGHHPLIRNP